MKLSLECSVESRANLETETEITHNDRIYTFYPNEEGFISKIKIVVPVEHPERFYSIVTPDPKPGVKLHIDVKKDKELYDSVVYEFQELESLMALTHNVKNITWSSPRYDLICETEEERDRAELLGMHSPKSFVDLPKPATEATLRNVIEYKNRYDTLVVPLSFLREGANELHAYKHINAFFNFYFVLEGLYGNGKTKNRDVENQFKNSQEITDYLPILLSDLPQKKPEYYNKLVEMLSRRHKQIGVRSIIELIVAIRGDLHHFTNNPNRPQGNPFTHSEFRAITFVVHGLAINAILQKMVVIDAQFGNSPVARIIS